MINFQFPTCLPAGRLKNLKFHRFYYNDTNKGMSKEIVLTGPAKSKTVLGKNKTEGIYRYSVVPNLATTETRVI